MTLSTRHDVNKVGIVFAREIEADGLRNALRNSVLAQRSRESADAYTAGPLEVILKVTSTSGACSAAAEQLILDGAGRLIIAGFAASLASGSRAGDIVIAESVRSQKADLPVIKCSTDILSAAPPDGTLGYRIVRADIVSADERTASPEHKHALRDQTGATAVDTVSYPSAQVCSAAQVPFASIRAISETVDQHLPEHSGGLAAAARKLVSTSARRLASQMREQELAASEALGEVLGIMLLRMA